MTTTAQLKREIEQLKRVYQATRAAAGPLCKIFFHEEGKDIEKEKEAYMQAHPDTLILNLKIEDCGLDA